LDLKEMKAGRPYTITSGKDETYSLVISQEGLQPVGTLVNALSTGIPSGAVQLLGWVQHGTETVGPVGIRLFIEDEQQRGDSLLLLLLGPSGYVTPHLIHDPAILHV